MMKDLRSFLKGLLVLDLFILILLIYGVSFAEPVSKENAMKVAERFLDIQKSLPEKVMTKVEKFHYAKRISSEYARVTTKEIKKSDGTILAYIHEMEPQGYIITSADSLIRPVLGYSFTGTFPFEDSKDNILLHLIRWDVEERLKLLNQPNEAAINIVKTNKNAWNSYASGSVAPFNRIQTPVQQWGPWLETQWDQGGMFSHFNNKIPYKDPSAIIKTRRLVGCTATAMAQIVNYWKYPSYVDFNADPWPAGDTYDTSTDKIHIDGDAATYGFPTFSELKTNLSVINYNGNNEEEAYLSFAAGIKVKMNYGKSESGAFASAFAYLNGFSYGSAAVVNGSNVWVENNTKVINNMKEEWPVQMSIYGDEGGHSVVVDGYKDTGEFHLNLGWGGSDDDWYFLPDVDTSWGNPDFNVIRQIVYNIAPYKGWYQYGADENNSFRTIYFAPKEHKDKWQVTCPDTHSFSGLVVGAGNKIYASVSPRFMGGQDLASIYIINQYGDKEKEIVLNGVNEGITYPVQSGDGKYIFVGTDSGYIYRVNTKNNAVTNIFTEPTGQQFFDPPKIDKDGNLYFGTLSTLYSITSSGTERWHYTPPGGASTYIIRSSPAIDSSRNRVYIPYMNNSAKRTYLASLDRNTGNLISTRTFGSNEYSSDSPGTPSIGSDGTIYISNYSTLYALDPNNISGTPIWSRNFYPSNMATNAPVIGRDGTIYVSYWTQVGSTWYMNFAALNANLTNKWVKTFLADVSNDNIMQPYVASNGIIVFSYNLSNGSNPDTFEVWAYEDNGNDGVFLWKHNYGASGGNLAFGPGATVYVIPVTGYGHTIYAISEGDVGDPNGAAMAFTNNNPPNLPTNPNPSDGATDIGTEVTLSWSDSDPDGHSLTYEVHGGADDGGGAYGPIATQINTNSYHITGLNPDVAYHWMVVATDGQSVTESPIWSFTTAPAKNYYCDTDGDFHISLSISGTCTGAGCVPVGCQTTPGDDCDDGDALVNPGATEGPSGDATCSDGLDNDCDGLTDADPECLYEIDCFDFIDNDNDGLTDCADPDCNGTTYGISCNTGLLGICSIGHITCSNGAYVCVQTNQSQPEVIIYGNCNDEQDNDCDGLTDTDPECLPETLCFDGIDNDNDGLTDCADSDCNGATDGLCSTALPGICSSGTYTCSGSAKVCVQNNQPQTEGPAGDIACGDGLDNDCDNTIDVSDISCGVALPGAINLPQTGQTKCYDSAGVEIACAGTGQDGEIRAGMAWPNPRFTVSGDCVTDNLTGLMWAKNANLPNGTGTWQGALDYVASLNSSGGLCGYTDWQLPNVKELESLINADVSNTAVWLNNQGFTNVQPDFYWSSTTVKSNSQGAWFVHMWQGQVNYWEKSLYYYIWPVRSSILGVVQLPKTGQTKCYDSAGVEIACAGTGQDGEIRAGMEWPNPRFTVSGDCVTDNLTGLMWTKNANLAGYKTWQGALDYVASLNSSGGLCGYTEWRLSNRKELLSLTDYSRSSPALPEGSPFANLQDNYWTSNTYIFLTNQAWFYRLDTGGGDITIDDKNSGYGLWPVRGGQVIDYYCDSDVDGHVSASVSGGCGGIGCVPAGCQTTPGDDCDDTNSAVHPGITEIAGNGKDDDCNPATRISLMGEINKDDLVDISDVILVLRCALNLPIDPYQCMPCGDINKDGVIDISDVILTLRMALKLDPLQQCI